MTRRIGTLSISAAFATVLWIMLLLVGDEAAAQSKKVSGTASFGPVVSQTTLLPPDAVKHEVSLVNRTITWNGTDPDWTNVAVTQFVYSDYVAGNGYHRGHNVNTHPGGDRTFMSYEGQTKRSTNPDGSWQATFEGTIRFTGGTGKFQGVTGQGTYIGKSSATSGAIAQAATFEWQLEYTVPK